MSEVEKIPIEQAVKQVGYKSVKGFKSWCKRNNVLIFKSGKSWNVLRIEFEAAKDRELIKELKRIHGDKWEEIYDRYRLNDKSSLILDYGQKTEKSYMARVPPSSAVGRAFLEKAKRA